MGDLKELFTNLISIVIGGGAGSYLAWRRLKVDANGDKIDAKSHQLIEHLDAQLKEARAQAVAEREHAKNCDATVERLAKERNAAVSAVGRLEGTIEALREKIATLTDEIQTLERDGVRMREEMQKHRASMDDLSEMNRKILLALQGMHVEGVSKP